MGKPVKQLCLSSALDHVNLTDPIVQGSAVSIPFKGFEESQVMAMIAAA